MTQQSRYLVTGAAGFIGSAVARRLVADGHEVVTIDNLSTGLREAVPEGVELIEGNCQDAETIARLGDAPFDAILHIAGQSSGEVSFDDPVYDLQTNAQSMLLLLDWARRTGCRRVLYASTMSVYGDGYAGPVREDAALSPKSFYAVGKRASEGYLKIFAAEGISATALRLFNVYGPGQNMKNLRQGMVSIYLAQALADHRIVVKGSLDRFRDFVFIDDVVEAFIASLHSAADGCRVYNVGTGIKTSVAQVIESIQAALPFDVAIAVAGATPGDLHGVVADASAIRRELGWTSRVMFAQGLARMVDWAMTHGREASA